MKFALLSESELTTIVFGWLDERKKYARWRDAKEVMHALETLCRVPFDRNQPCFLDGQRTDPKNIVTFRNGLLDITDIGGKLRLADHTPQFFSSTALQYDFDEEAPCPKWEKFLGEVLVDEDRIELLQRWAGLLLIPETSYQKILLLVGPRRSGKGTTLKVIEHAIGSDACVWPSLGSLASEFGLWQLVGRTVAIFADAHIGRRADATGIMEVMKSISGEDHVSINRKNLPYLQNVTLPVRFILTCNELPRFTDASLALESRLLVLPFAQSFEGTENLTLQGELKEAAPGILNWMLRGLFKLRKAGRFNTPAKSREIVKNYRRMVSPITGFIEDCCDVRVGAQTRTEVLFRVWETWAKQNGHRPGAISTFGEHLHAADNSVIRRRPRDDAVGRYYVYDGIELSQAGEAMLTQLNENTARS